jgi:hypothetical protein
MATPKKKKFAKGPHSGASQSKNRAQGKAVAAGTIKRLHRLSEKGPKTQPQRRPTMAAEDIKKTAEELQKTGRATAEDIKRTSEEFARAAGNCDVRGMSQAWKQSYLHGLEAFFQSQEQTERLLKETVKQGISGSQQILQGYEKWLDQIQGQAGAGSPFVEWSRQLVRSFHTNADPIFKGAADATESAFNYYQNALARPSRKYAADLNKKAMDTVISA